MEEWLQKAMDAYPWFGKVVLFYVMAQVLCRIVADLLFGVAATIGRMNSERCKWVIGIGKLCWRTALFFHAFGFGTSKRFLEAKYVARSDNSRN